MRFVWFVSCLEVADSQLHARHSIHLRRNLLPVQARPRMQKEASVKSSPYEVYNAAKAKKAARRKAKAKRIGAPTKAMLRKSLQKAIKALTIDLHRAIRANDGPICISCGQQIDNPRNWNAGHLFAVGPYPGIRFHPMNIASQCVGCNNWKGGNHAAYAAQFIRRHGFAAFMALDERKGDPMQWRAEELIQLREALRSAGFAAYVNLYFELEGKRITERAA